MIKLLNSENNINAWRFITVRIVEFANDTSNHETFIQHQGLIIKLLDLLSSEDYDTTYAALETLKNLSNSPAFLLIDGLLDKAVSLLHSENGRTIIFATVVVSSIAKNPSNAETLIQQPGLIFKLLDLISSEDYQTACNALETLKNLSYSPAFLQINGLLDILVGLLFECKNTKTIQWAINQIRILAKNPSNAETLIQQPGLIFTLLDLIRSEDFQTAYDASETLKYLEKSPEFLQTDGLLDKAVSLLHSENGRTIRLATGLIEILTINTTNAETLIQKPEFIFTLLDLICSEDFETAIDSKKALINLKDSIIRLQLPEILHCLLNQLDSEHPYTRNFAFEIIQKCNYVAIVSLMADLSISEIYNKMLIIHDVQELSPEKNKEFLLALCRVRNVNPYKVGIPTISTGVKTATLSYYFDEINRLTQRHDS